MAHKQRFPITANSNITRTRRAITHCW